MIKYLKGELIKSENGRVVVAAGGVGYEVVLPDIVWNDLSNRPEGEKTVELFISYIQTVQQPKPVLIGFFNEIELEFFELLIKVKDIGPLMASKALSLPVSVIAGAIEERDVATIQKLKGIGRRKADMIVSELNGKAGKYALIKDRAAVAVQKADDFSKQVADVLVKQLGHSRAEAVRMVDQAIKRKPDVQTPEELFEEVYRVSKADRDTGEPVSSGQ